MNCILYHSVEEPTKAALQGCGGGLVVGGGVVDQFVGADHHGLLLVSASLVEDQFDGGAGGHGCRRRYCPRRSCAGLTVRCRPGRRRRRRGCGTRVLPDTGSRCSSVTITVLEVMVVC